MDVQPQNPDFATRVQDSFDAQGLMQTLNAGLETIEPGRCIISAPITPAASQQHGYGHAGLTFAIGDSAAGFAAFTLMQQDREVLTAEIKINLLAPARGDRLEAVGTVLRPGNRLLTVQSDVYAIEGAARTHIAVLLGTMVAARIS